MTLTQQQLLAMDYKPISEFGSSFADDIIRWVNDQLVAMQNKQTSLLMGLCQPTSQRRKAWGGFVNVQSHRLQSDLALGKESNKPLNGQTIHIPLFKFDSTFSYTQERLNSQTPADVAQEVIGTRVAHENRTAREVMRAMFTNTTRTEVDFLVDDDVLDHCYPLAIADGLNYPNYPDGSAVDSSTHTHYNALAVLTAAGIDAVLEHVREHFIMADVALHINAANISTLAGLGGTKFLQKTWVTESDKTATVQANGTISRVEDRNNMAVGTWDGYPVETKPFVPANYYMAIARGTAEKPMLYRTSLLPSQQGIQTTQYMIQHPIYGKEYAWYFGVNAYNRLACAFLYGGGAAWVNPTIPA